MNRMLIMAFIMKAVSLVLLLAGEISAVSKFHKLLTLRVARTDLPRWEVVIMVRPI